MVEMIANSIVNQMEKEGFVQEEMKVHYVYALVTMIERWVTIFSILCIGAFFKQIVLMAIFLTFFFSLRKRTGGFHANTFWQCYFGSLVVSIVIIHGCPMLVNYMDTVYVLLICSVILVGWIGTVNHPNLAMNCIELQESKRAARNLLGLECMILVAAITLDISRICICYMSIAIVLCAFFLVLAKLLKQEV